MTLGPILRKVQRNDVLEALTDTHLDPAEFRWEQRTYTSGWYRGPAEVLAHQDGSYEYEFMLRDGSKHYARMRPGPQAAEAAEFPGSWEHQLRHVRRWAVDVYAELDAPDLWESVSSWSSLLEIPPTFELNTNFTQAELTEIQQRLEKVRLRLKQLSSDTKAAEVVDTLVDHLEASAQKQGRRDWLFLALGSMVSFMANAAFDPIRAREIFDLLVHGIGKLGGG